MVQSPVERPGMRAAYAARQGARLAWYVGQGFIMRRLRERAGRRNPPKTDLPLPGERALFAEIARLFARDLANIEAGLYPPPRDRDGPLPERLARSVAFFRDLPRVHARREAGRHREVREAAHGARRPRYYLQNFHFQSGGWLSEGSARLYDIQVEVLFNGTASVMRRQLLVPLAEFVRGRDQRRLRLLDLGCGTGRFLGQVAKAFPRLPAWGIDLSEAYVGEARRHLADRPRVRLAVAAAERLPFADGSFDCITATFLFHELPPRVRGAVAGEIARLLAPGGRLLLMDTLQTGDRPDYDGLIDLFPQNFHEPYYAGYVCEDLTKRFGAHGLMPRGEAIVFVSKISQFEKGG